MTSSFPYWVADLGTLSSIVGLGVTALLLWEARKIRDSFIRKARLPEIIRDLVAANKVIANSLKDWSNEEKEGIRQFKIAKQLLENLKPKLPEAEKKKVNVYVQMLEERTWLILTSAITTAKVDKAWDLYSELSASITALQQLQKDSKWD